MSGFGMPLGDNLTESHDLLKKYKEEIKKYPPNSQHYVVLEETIKELEELISEADRPIDFDEDIEKYNCAGLAFRDYQYWRKADVEKKLKDECKPSTKDAVCEGEYCLKCVYYEITGVEIYENGAVIRRGRVDDYHIVCGLGDGSGACSKNGGSPIEKPGNIDSYPPNQPFRMRPLPEGQTLKPVFTTSYYCCKEEK